MVLYCPHCGGRAEQDPRDPRMWRCTKCGRFVPTGKGELPFIPPQQPKEKFEGIKGVLGKIKGRYNKWEEKRKKDIELQRKLLAAKYKKEYGVELSEEELEKMLPYETLSQKIKGAPKKFALGLTVPFLLGGLSGEDRRKKLWEMARGKPEVYSWLARPTPYQIFGEILFILAIVLLVGGNWPAAIALFWVGFLILSVYTSPILVGSVFPICALVYLLWFGPIPTFIAFPITLLALLVIIFIAIIIPNTLAKIFILIIGFLVLGIIWGMPNIFWTPGYPDWLKKVGIPLAGTTPNSLLSNILPIPPALITILGWIIVILTFHLTYSSTLASPTLAEEPGRTFFGNVLIVFAIFFILGIDWVEAAGTIAGGVDYFTCLSREFASMHWLTTGKDIFEICSKKEEKIILRKFGMYNFFNVKLGVEELNYEVSNIIPGKNYTLWFTITNLKDEEFLINNIFVNQPVYNHTNLNLTDYNETHLKIIRVRGIGEEYVEFIPKDSLPQDVVNEMGEKIDSYFLSDEEKGWFIDYVRKHELSIGELINVFKKADCAFIKKDGKNYLNVGDNGCHAKIFIPLDLREYKPKIVINWNQSVEGYDKIRIVSDLKYVEKYYKPTCIEEKGVPYECPATTEGPIDLGVGFIPKQYIVNVTPSLEVVVKITNNKVKGTAKFMKEPEIEGFDLGGCKDEIKEYFKNIPWENLAYRERPYVTEPPCDLKEKGKLPESLDVPYIEYKIKISANYTYFQPFELLSITAG